MIHKCNHFILQELLPKPFYEANHKSYGVNLWFVFDPRGLVTLDRLRGRYGKTYMNNWKWGGKDNYRALRHPACKIGAKLSQHRFGRGFDPWFDKVTADEVRVDLFKNPTNKAFEHITTIEDGKIAKTWFHFDTRGWDVSSNGLLIVKPRRAK